MRKFISFLTKSLFILSIINLIFYITLDVLHLNLTILFPKGDYFKLMQITLLINTWVYFISLITMLLYCLFNRFKWILVIAILIITINIIRIFIDVKDPYMIIEFVFSMLPLALFLLNKNKVLNLKIIAAFSLMAISKLIVITLRVSYILSSEFINPFRSMEYNFAYYELFLLPIVTLNLIGKLLFINYWYSVSKEPNLTDVSLEAI